MNPASGTARAPLARLLLLLLLALLAPPAAFAGDACCPPPADPHAGHGPAAHEAAPPSAPAADPHAGRDHAEKAAPPAGDACAGHDHAAHAAPRKAAPAGDACADGHAGHDHAGHGHAHVGPGPIHDRPFAEIAAIDCNHATRAVECPACRFEVGVVRLDPSSELFKIEKPSPARALAALELPGELRFASDRVRVVAARVPGRIVDFPVRVGDRVRPGDPLARIESAELSLAALDYLKRLADASFAARRLARDAPLAERRMITDQEHLDARAANETASLEVRIARKRLLLAGLTAAQIARLEADPDDPIALGRLEILAPIAGRITARGCETGEMVPTDHALATIADPALLHAVAACHERDLPLLRAALAAGRDSVEVAVLSSPGRAFPGRIFSLDPSVSRESRALPVWIEVGNGEELLADGMFCTVRVELAASGAAVPSLPREAVLEDAGRSFVFLRARDDLFMARVVAAFPLGGDRVGVPDLPADADVVTRGAFLLKSDILREKMGAGCAD